ncbi:MAG: 16S rRNA (guanine(966)-N(2))-methyltransferase RsmD [Thermodesulfobacteriota bacterium]
MRIIAGTCKGHRLASLKGLQTRPTQDRIREAIFNILEGYGPFEQVADLFAGSGALGLEALSRWGGKALFVDHSKAALACLRDNMEHLKLTENSLIVERDFSRGVDFLKKAGSPFDLVFLDPPYGQDWGPRILPLLFRLPILKETGVMVFEHDMQDRVPEKMGGWEIRDQRRYGRTKVSFYHSMKG